MTLPTSYDNLDNENKSFFSELININYFKNYFKKDRILMLIMTICFFILSPLITFFMYSNGKISATTAVDFNRIMYCVIAVVCGTLLPLYLFNYNHSRKSSIFFNSIPIKKHTLYNTHAFLGLVYFLVSVTFNFILVTLLILLNNPASDTFTGAIPSHFLGYVINLIIFIAVYCAMIFVANIAGTSLSSVILYVYVNFYLCSWIAIMYLVFEMICSYTMFRATDEMVFNTSFIMYVISKVSNMSLLQALIILAISVGLYICGILFNSRQKTEKAERSMYFEKFEQIFKYSMLAVVIIIVGVAFYQNGNVFGYYIGSLFGGVVGLILMNIITRKNIKESFYKFRNFIIFFLIITLASVPVIFILTFLDTYAPDIDSIAYVESQAYMTNNLYSFRQYGSLYNWTGEDWSEEEKAVYNSGNVFSSYKRTMQIKDKSAIEAVNDMQKTMYSSDYNYVNYQVGDYDRFTPFLNGFDYKFNSGYRLSKKMMYNIFSQTFEVLNSAEYKDALYRLNSSRDYINSTFYPIFDDKIMDLIYNKSYNVNINYNPPVITEDEAKYTQKEFVFDISDAAELIDALKKDIVNISSDKEKFLAIYDGILENNKYIENYPVHEGGFNEYTLYFSFGQINIDGVYVNSVEFQIIINDYFTETLRFIEENLK